MSKRMMNAYNYRISMQPNVSMGRNVGVQTKRLNVSMGRNVSVQTKRQFELSMYDNH